MKLSHLFNLFIAFISLSIAHAGEILVNGSLTGGTASWAISGSGSEWADTKGIIPGLHSSFEDGAIDGEGYLWYIGDSTGFTTTQSVTTVAASTLTLSADFQQRDDTGVPGSHSNATFTLELLDVANGNAVLTPQSTTGAFPPDSTNNGTTPDPAQSVSRSYQNLPAGTYTVRITIADGQGAVDNVSLIDSPALAAVVHNATDIPKAIPDNGTVTSDLLVLGETGVISDIDVTLDITHTRAEDLEVFLIAPDGTRVELFTDVGGSGSHFTGTTLDDEAGSSIWPGNTAPFSGTYQPESSLTAMDGRIANGTWKLEVSDDQATETGTLNSWSLNITTPVSENNVKIDDHFDDSSATTNANGIGTGFNTHTLNGGNIQESGTNLNLNSPTNGGFITAISSKENLDATLGQAVTFKFSSVSFSDLTPTTSTGLNRIFIGVRQAAGLGFVNSFATLGHGFYISFEDDKAASGHASPFGQNGWSGTSAFFYVDETGAATQLASWTFDTLDWNDTAGAGPENYTPVMDITMELTASTWSLAITGDTRDGGSPISFSGANSFGGDDNHGVTTGHAYIYNQTETPNLSASVDRVICSNPTPALDSDGDGLTDDEEVATTLTNPSLTDTDMDGIDDGAEIALGYDPNNVSSTPPAGSSLSGVSSVGSYLDGVIPANTPGGIVGNNWQKEDFFTAMGDFQDLIGVAAEPNSTFIAVLEIRGTIQRVDASNRTTTGKQQVLDIRDRAPASSANPERLLRSVAFHPNYNMSGATGENFVYVTYQTEATSIVPGFTAPYNNFPVSGSPYHFYRLSRFTRNPATQVIDPASEVIMIQQMCRETGQHLALGLTFGKDGFLYLTWGDLELIPGDVGLPKSEFYQDAQRIDRIFESAVLRLDVDMQGGAISQAPTVTLQGNTGAQAMAGTTQSCQSGHNYYHHDNFSGVGYFIPSDNHWVVNPPAAGTASTSPSYPAHGAALQEHHAMGLRNPWRMTTDPVSGDIAIFVVGSNSTPKHESVQILKAGANYGWPYLEGRVSKTAETQRTQPPRWELLGTYLSRHRN